jgi:hypothetical protein
MPKFVPEVGQIIYVNAQWWGRSEPNLSEYRVTKVNTVSFYAERTEPIRVNGSTPERRFNKRSMTSKDSVGTHFIAYETAEEYWARVRFASDVHEKREWIIRNISTVKMAGLQQIEEVIKAEMGRK